jgi:hypothetical protein
MGLEESMMVWFGSVDVGSAVLTPTDYHRTLGTLAAGGYTFARTVIATPDHESSIKSVCQHIINHSTTSSSSYSRWICHCTILYNVSKSPVFEGCGYSILINYLLLHNNIFSLTIIIHLILLLSTKILFVFIVALFDVTK